MGRAFSIKHRRVFWAHIGIPFSNSLSKAKDPHINSATLVRLSYSLDPNIRKAVAENLASRFHRTRDPLENRLSSFEQKNLPRFDPTVVIEAISLSGGRIDDGWMGDKKAFLCFFETACLSLQDIETILEILSNNHSGSAKEYKDSLHLRKAQHPDTPVDEIVSCMVKEVQPYSRTWEETETRTEWQQVGQYKLGLDHVAPVTEEVSLGTRTSSGISYGKALDILRAHSREKRIKILQIIKERDSSLYQYISEADSALFVDSLSPGDPIFKELE